MQTSERGIVALISHEGIVPGPYRDSVGVWTFGRAYGIIAHVYSALKRGSI